MTHPETTELQRWLDGELSHRKARRLDGHVQSCGTCHQRVDELRTAGDLVRLALADRSDDPALAGLSDLVMTAIANPKPLPRTERWRAWASEVLQHRRTLWAPPLALGTAAAVALLTFAFLVHPPSPTEVPPQSEVISVSFGNSVQGTLFQIEDKDGSRTAVIWVDGNAPEQLDNNTEARWPLGWESIGMKTS